jgi:hypothetical protein
MLAKLVNGPLYADMGELLLAIETALKSDSSEMDVSSAIMSALESVKSSLGTAALDGASPGLVAGSLTFQLLEFAARILVHYATMSFEKRQTQAPPANPVAQP